MVIEEFPDPKPGPREVVVRLRASAICGSDIYAYRASSEQLAKRPKVIQGHEPSGIVEAVGPEVSSVKVGDRVTVYHYLGCGHCPDCAAGNLMWCQNTRGLGGQAHGGHADLLLVDEVNALLLPEELTFIDGAAIACIGGTTYSALSKIAPSGKDTLAVFGLGPVGLTGVMFGKAFGARVIAVGRQSIRLNLARSFGADEIIDLDSTDDPAKRIWNLTGGIGVDAAYETAGSREYYMAMVRSLRKGGRAVVVSGARFGVGTFDPGMIVSKQLTIMGSFVMPVHMYWSLVKFMLMHNLHFEPMVTHRFPLENAAEAFAIVDSRQCGKVIFEWLDSNQ